MLKRLLLLNGLSIVGVVCAHAAQWLWIAMFWWVDRYRPVAAPNFDLLGTAPYYGVVVLQKAGVFAVPGFLLATGFFLAYAHRASPTTTWKGIGGRLKALFVPYLIWSVVIFLGEYAQGITGSPGDYARRIALGEAIDTYWYVFVLFQLYLLSALLIPLAKDRSRLLLVGTGALLGSIILLFYTKFVLELLGVSSTAVDAAIRLVPTRSFARWLFFLALGMVAGFHLPAFKAWLARNKWVLLAVALVSFPLAVIETELIFQTTGEDWRGGVFTITGVVYALSVVLAFLSFERADFPLSKLAIEIGQATFGIYLLHNIVLELSARASQKYVPSILAFPVLFQLLLTLLGVAVPLAAMKLVARSPAQRWHRYLFG